MKKFAILIMALVLAMNLTAGTAYAETETADALFGVQTGDAYENTFIGLGCTLAGWHYYSDEEIEEVNKQALGFVSDDVREMMESSGNVTLMAAESATGLEQINIQAQNVKQYVALYEMLGVESVIDSQLDTLRSVYEQTGFEDLEIRRTEITIGSRTLPVVRMSYKLMGVQMYMQQAWYLQNDHLVYLTISTAMADTTDDLVACFYEVN